MNTTIIRPELFHPDHGQGRQPPESQPWHRPLLLRCRDWLEDRLARRRDGCPTLLLELPDRCIKFRSLDEFTFSLASRTDFPVVRMRAMMKHSPQELEQTAQNIHDIERQFSDVIAKSAVQPHLIGEFFADLRIKLFSQDHDWRDIMDGLRRLSPDFDDYKRVALVKYMQYLRSRQQILKNVFMEKTRDDADAAIHATPTDAIAMEPDQRSTAIFDVTSMADRHAREKPREKPVHEAHPETRAGREFVSLEKGETCCIKFAGQRELQLSLAGNYFKLYSGKEFYLTDDGGNTYPLRNGKNLVGRHSGCDVVVDQACRSISRHHLIIEPVAEDAALLTDLSAHGTEIPAAAA